ncbi:hypothetical protein HK096_010514, partial [Nowakowskiella sp. JEL0078]
MNSAVLTLLGPELFLSGSSPYPKCLLPFSITNMTFSESVINAFYQQLDLMGIGIKFWGIMRKIVYGIPIFWNMNDVFENRLVLMSTTPEFSPSEGLPSRFVYIGASILAGNVSMGRNRISLGRTQNEKEIVKTDITTWMNEKYEANIDVVYVAFGTVAVPSTADFIKILNGLASEKRAILWSINSDFHHLIKNSSISDTIIQDNIRLENWVQQKAILSHPATKLFFSHGGFNSLVEGVTNNLPMLCRPMFADQPYNCRRLQDLGISKTLRYNVDIEEEVRNLSSKVLADYEFYKQNVKRLGESFRNAGGAKKAVDKLEEYFIFGGPQGWKTSELSWSQRNHKLIALIPWITVILYLRFIW